MRSIKRIILPLINLSKSNDSPLRLLLIIIITIFLTETGIMIVLARFTSLQPWVETILDSFSLVVFIFPSLYFFIFKPLLLNINRQKQIEKELQQQAVFYMQNPAPVIQTNYSGVILNYNPAADQIFNKHLKGRSVYELFPNVKKAKTDLLMETGAKQFLEQIGEMYFLFTIKNNKAGETYYFYGCDVTDRINNEKSLKESESKFRFITETSVDFIFQLDNKGFTTFCSPSIKDILLYEPEEVCGKDFSRYFPDTELSKAENFFRTVMSGKNVKGLEFQVFNKNMNLIHIEINASPILKNYMPIGVQGIVRDITGRIEQQKAIKESQSRIDAIFETAGEGIIVTNEKGDIILVNKECLKIFKFKQDQLINKNITVLIPEKYRTKHYDGMKNYLKSGKPNVIGKRVELEGLRSDNTIFPLELKIVDTRVGEKRYFTASIRDITERIVADEKIKQYQNHLEQLVEERTEKLRKSEERFDLAMKGANDGVWDWNLITNEVYFSPRWKNILGYEDNEIESSLDAWKNLLHKDDLNNMLAMVRNYLGGKSDEYSNEFRMLHKSGSYVDILARGFAVRDDSGKPVRLVGTHVDITKRKKALKDLEESEKKLIEVIATKDKFFSIISHDLRAPFQGILGMSEILMLETDDLDKEQIKEFAGDINYSSSNLYSLLNNLLEWSRLQTGSVKFQPAEIKLQSIIENVIQLLNNNAKEKNISLTSSTSENILVHADTRMLHSIIQNLTSNSIKFTNTGGEIKIISVLNSHFAEISISDNGVGMDDEMLNKLFRIDTQISSLGTKKEKGSGLGLLLCKDLVERHGGRIWLESEIGRGTKFTFTIPLTTGINN